ncbi:MAG TPA: DUF4215 domain-containing protein [bacterium]|nr:DUF4215 domain-containing protein [bacterium]
MKHLGKALGFAIAAFLSAQAAPAATLVGDAGFRISHTGTDGDADFDATSSDIAYNSADDQYLVIWIGEAADNEFEVFGRTVDAATGAPLGADFRISHMGPDGNTSYRARRPAVAYNSTDNEYMVVWAADDDTGTLIDGEDEIFGRRVAADGSLVGSDHFRISDLGPDGNAAYDADDPAIAYNPTANQYVVVWIGDTDAGALVDGEDEVFGQRLNAAGGIVGANDFRISDMGPDGSTTYKAIVADVAYNAVADEYLVVWEGDDNTAPLVDEELEIFGQRIDAATGAALGTNDFRITHVGPDGDADYRTFDPSLAYNPDRNEYLLVWYGFDDAPGLAADEDEIFGSRLDATGTAIGANHFRISDAGTDGDSLTAAVFPKVSYNRDAGEYLVVWQADDAPLAVNEREIFGQRIAAATGAETGTNDFRISAMGPDGDTAQYGDHPAVAYGEGSKRWLVSWEGTIDLAPLVVGEFEIYGQFLAVPGCGNGFTESGEECDDGNLADGDGCDASCQDEDAGTTGGTASGGTTGGKAGGTSGDATGGATAGTSGENSGGGCSLIRS